jgi:hypothetical protein
MEHTSATARTPRPSDSYIGFERKSFAKQHDFDFSQRSFICPQVCNGRNFEAGSAHSRRCRMLPAVITRTELLTLINIGLTDAAVLQRIDDLADLLGDGLLTIDNRGDVHLTSAGRERLPMSCHWRRHSIIKKPAE